VYLHLRSLQFAGMVAARMLQMLPECCCCWNFQLLTQSKDALAISDDSNLDVLPGPGLQQHTAQQHTV
jgi:hypothetical protein